MALPAIGHSTSNNFIFSSLWTVNLKANYPNTVCSLRDQLMQMSTTDSSFDQYCISHKTISHRTRP